VINKINSHISLSLELKRSQIKLSKFKQTVQKSELGLKNINFKTYFSRFINEDVLFHRFVTCMDFARGSAEDIVNNDLIQSLKE